MKKRTKWSVAGVIGLAIVIIGVTSAMKGRNKATEVRIEKVQKRDLVASVTASGQVQPHTKVNVSADISGRIVRLAVKEGQMVTRGRSFWRSIFAVPRQRRAGDGSGRVGPVAVCPGQDRPLPGPAQFRSLMALKKANPNCVSDDK